MIQCIPGSDANDPSATTHFAHVQQPISTSVRFSPSPCSVFSAPGRQTPDYAVAELTWKNGNLAMHGHCQPVVGKPVPRFPSPAPWDKTCAGDTLESLVHQATCAAGEGNSVEELDAFIPCSSRVVIGAGHADGDTFARKRAKVRSLNGNYSDRYELTGGDEVVLSASANPVEELPEIEKTVSGKAMTGGDDQVSVGHSMDHSQLQRDICDKKGMTITMAKSSRTASVHNQSERKRRDRINHRMKTLQKLVPNSSKTDKASLLDEVIDYLKQLQAQVQMMSRMNSSSPMMMPVYMQQFQLPLMAQMAQMAQMGMGTGMVDMNFTRPSNPGIPPVLQPPAFVPFPAGDRLPTSGGVALPTPGSAVVPDPFSAFMACQAQPTNLEAYNRMATLYQQLHQQMPSSNPKT